MLCDKRLALLEKPEKKTELKPEKKLKRLAVF
jgi:hypothetical protein